VLAAVLIAVLVVGVESPAQARVAHFFYVAGECYGWEDGSYDCWDSIHLHVDPPHQDRRTFELVRAWIHITEYTADGTALGEVTTRGIYLVVWRDGAYWVKQVSRSVVSVGDEQCVRTLHFVLADNHLVVDRATDSCAT